MDALCRRDFPELQVCVPGRPIGVVRTNGPGWEGELAADRAARAFQAVALGFQSPVAGDFHGSTWC